MKISTWVAEGAGPNMAAAYANGQVWPKIMTLPQAFPIENILTVLRCSRRLPAT